MSHPFKTKPFDHQLETWEESKDLREFAVLWEQGTGKTKLTIDSISHQYLSGTITAVLIVAPSGVERNWVTDELPTHMPDEILQHANVHLYQSRKAATKWHDAAVKRCITHQGGLAVLAMSYDAFMTKRGKNYAWKFLQRHKVFYVLDESHAIKSPGAKRTKSIVASGRHATTRRILTGTPVAQGPFDIYTQMRFLDENFWRRRGIQTFAEFKQEFGIFTTEEIFVSGGQQREIEKLVGYQNLDELYRVIHENSSRVTKDDVLDLPPKLYSRRYFDMNREQERAYDEIVTEYMTEIDDEIIEAPLAIVRLLRLQQITCGYLPSGLEDKIVPIGPTNPRMQTLMDCIEEAGDKVIIWARFRQDIDQIMEALERMGRRPVRYDGALTDEECERSKVEFQRGDATDFVGNTAKGKEGLTLHAAKTMIYYNNTFKLIDRLQSEDRAHRIGQDSPVSYIDIMAAGTVDEHIVRSLLKKFDISTQITGDQLKKWIRE